MPKITSVTSPYFSHDMAARTDEKIMKMFFDFRKTFKDDQFAALGAYGIFWSVVEYMHKNILKVDDIEILADELRIDSDIIKKILNDYNLFHIEEGCYVSDRINKNLNQVEEKTNKLSESATKRWALSNLKKIYKQIFNTSPVLTSVEISIFLDYQKKIDEFKELLPDILYTLSKLKFDNNPNFVPSINWLLEGNNLPKLLNGHFGKLRSWEKHLQFISKKQGLLDDTEDSEPVDMEKIKEKMTSIFKGKKDE